jgi:hypothetical protein
MATEAKSVALRNFLVTVLIIAGAWTLSSLGYFQLEPILRADVGYNDAPLEYAAYYGVWSLGVFAIFRGSFKKVGDLSPTPFRLGILTIMALVFAGFALVVLPRLPEMEWTRTNSPVEFF